MNFREGTTADVQQLEAFFSKQKTFRRVLKGFFINKIAKQNYSPIKMS